MSATNQVYIATSLDGYIADKNGGIDWLNMIPNPDNLDLGFHDFTSKMDALVMGRTTFETVCGFDIEWPYQIPVFVLSNSLKEVPAKYKGKVEIVNGDLNKIVEDLNKRGYLNLYIDGGRTIQSFLERDLIDDLIITTIPCLLGEGIPLFSKLSQRLDFKCVESKIFLNALVQNHFVRTR
ncbi:dihydrofolate reductase family protein [Aureivirga sp. CE67]|uniref:dihydrofolate reductase family protein n=1 Tax=Aureivirga sp. CE67 TaxID=1788983 RepID=UPI0018C978BB|nr:dihydrofolate reductase family protein [Aureivirga sp. CE67]